MSETPAGSRPPASEIPAITKDGVRYEQDQVHASDDDQNGGYLAAYDAVTNEKLWRLKVYEVIDYSSSGVEQPGLYFKSMQLVEDGTVLEIVNESGSRYNVDLEDKSSKFIDGPPPEVDEPPAPDTRPPLPGN